MHRLLMLALFAAPLAAAEGVPPDVAAFLKQRALCVHFLQEPWPEGTSAEELDRRAYIVNQVDRFCTGLAEAEGDLRRRYRGERAVIDKLDRE